MELHPVHKIFSDNPNPNAGVIEMLQRYLRININFFPMEDWLYAYDELEPIIPKIQNRNEFVLHNVCFSDIIKWSLWDSNAIIHATTPCSEYICRCYDKLRSIALRKLSKIRAFQTKEELLEILTSTEYV